MRSAFRILAVATIILLASQTWAGIEGRYRITLMDKKTVIEGDVKELPDGSYEVKTKHGAVMTLKKSQVLDMKLLEAAPPKGETAVNSDATAQPAASSATVLRRPITDAEVAEVLSGIVATPDEAVAGVGRDDMMAPLPVDEESVKVMLKEAGADRQKNVMEKDHFVMVYTSSEQSARDLGSRLEAVYRWNVKFLSMLNVPAHKPEHKLEVYYFGTFKEYEAYSLNHSFPVQQGNAIALGYYMPDLNRSHFFDMDTSPDIAQLKEELKNPAIPPDRRQFITNRIKRYVDFHNVEVIQHETGHHIHFNIGLFPRDSFSGGGVPIWLVEGTTMMFEVPPSTEGASLGVLNHFRLFHLRTSFGPKPLSAAEWKLFLIDNNLWHNAAGHGSVVDSYQLGWSMVYFLWKEHREGYGKFLRTVFGRQPGETITNTEREKEFEDCFGRIDEKWIDGYYKFLSELQIRPSLLPPGEREAAEQGAGRDDSRHRGGSDSGSKQGGGKEGGGSGRRRG